MSRAVPKRYLGNPSSGTHLGGSRYAVTEGGQRPGRDPASPDGNPPEEPRAAGPPDHLLEQIDALPSLPPVLLRVADLLQKPATSAAQLAGVILEDQALTARLLRLVNSPFYGFPRQIATVTETLTILGFRPVQHLLLTATVVDLLQAEETPEFSPIGLWQHAVGTAVAARLLARTAGYEAQEAVFVAGLLHDVGKLVQLQCLRAEFLEALTLARDGDLPLHEAETRIWGFDHTQVGQALLAAWRLPSELCEAVGCHHRPGLARQAQWESAIIHVADILAHALGLGASGEDVVPPPEEAAWEWVGVPLASLEPLLQELELQHRELLGVLLGTLRAFPGLDAPLREASWTDRGLRATPQRPG
jgi:HD-like signal output (HDOD) protein